MKYLKYISVFILSLFLLSGCELSDVEEFKGTITGVIFDTNQKIVPSDIMSNTLIVKVLGEGDITPITIRVKGDGTYQNTNLFPKKHKAWIEGPIIPIDTFEVDLTGKQHVEKDITVIPYISISNEIVNAPLANSVKVKYAITANTSAAAIKREIYCSTLKYPTSSSGSGPFYSSVKATITNNQGEITLSGLVSNTKYFIRIGANVNGKSMNYSPQLEISTPSN